MTPKTSIPPHMGGANHIRITAAKIQKFQYQTTKGEKIMRKTDPQQPAEAQAGARRIQRAGIFSRIAAAAQSAFHRAFPPLYYVSLDTTLPLIDLQYELDSIRRLKRTGARVKVLYWRCGTELFRQLPCDDCPKRPEYLTEHTRRQEVVLKILDELLAS